MTFLSSACNSWPVSSFRLFMSSCAPGADLESAFPSLETSGVHRTRPSLATHLNIARQPPHILLQLLIQPVRLALQDRRQTAQRDPVVPALDLRAGFQFGQGGGEEVGFLCARSSADSQEVERGKRRRRRTFSKSCLFKISRCARSSSLPNNPFVNLINSLATPLFTPAPSSRLTNC